MASFKYTALPSAQSIRLLEISTDAGHYDKTTTDHEGYLQDDVVVVCKLITIDLDDPVPYDALSYTWGQSF
jgi:hypothetical protein